MKRTCATLLKLHLVAHTLQMENEMKDLVRDWLVRRKRGPTDAWDRGVLVLEADLLSFTPANGDASDSTSMHYSNLRVRLPAPHTSYDPYRWCCITMLFIARST